LIQQISTFAINYQGRPFRESIRENRAMFYGLVGVAAIAFAGAMETFPELNEKLRLVQFTQEFRQLLTITMIIDYAGCYVIEKTLKYLFSDYRPKDIALRRPDQIEAEIRRREIEENAAEEILIKGNPALART
jgi:cation-transporting ATPase 13A1